MTGKSIVIIGGGGHTRVLIGMLKRANMNIRGVLTRDAALVGTDIHGVPVLGIDGEFALNAADTAIVNGVGNKASRQGGGFEARVEVYHRYHDLGFFIAPVISGDAITQPDITVGAGVQIMPGAVIQPGAMLGENAIINTRASIDHDVVIAPHAHVAPGAVLCGGVSVGEQTHIGAGAVIIQGISIGSRAIIGAGVTVTRDVPDGAVVLPPTA